MVDSSVGVDALNASTEMPATIRTDSGTIQYDEATNRSLLKNAIKRNYKCEKDILHNNLCVLMEPLVMQTTRYNPKIGRALDGKLPTRTL